jgi:hypothetical protein
LYVSESFEVATQSDAETEELFPLRLRILRLVEREESVGQITNSMNVVTIIQEMTLKRSDQCDSGTQIIINWR